MIAQSTIDKVLEAAEAVEVIMEYVDLKKKGVNYTGNCPFHDEKTGSFVVSPSKNMFKCFGCGKGGSALSFVMEYDKKSYPEAIEALAAKYNIAVERTNEPVDTAKVKDKEVMEQIVAAAQESFISNRNHAAFKDYADSRELSEDVILNWGLGWNGDNYRLLTAKFVMNGWFDMAKHAGLVTSKVDKNGDNRNYDVYVNRVTIPIYDNRGVLCGFGGRYVGEDANQAKYINPKESALYTKSDVLFGLDKGLRHISKSKTAVLVEGYFDVISLHENGCPIAVAGCGTAFTPKQAARLSKIAETIILFYDPDKAGVNATMKAAELLMATDKNVRVFTQEKNEETGRTDYDPDEYARQFVGEVNDESGEVETLQEHIIENSQDAVLWAYEYFFEGVAKDDITGKAQAMNKVCSLLVKMTEFKRQQYLKIITKRAGVSAKSLLPEIEKLQAAQTKGERSRDDSEIPEGIKTLPKGVDEKMFINEGMAPLVDTKNPERTGYYFRTKEGYIKIGNFVVEPLYHVYGEDNYRMVIIDNGRIRTPLLIASKDLISLDSFEKVLFNEGNFIFEYGTKLHLQRINMAMGQRFPLCYIISQLGWQNEGFFAFSNMVYSGEIMPYTDLGIVTYKEKNYLSPSVASKNSKHRQVDDQYENDRYLEYVKTDVSFETWAALFAKVYPEHAIPGIAFALVSLFKDVVQKSTRVPLLYAYGKIESGKSEFAESITYLFFSGKDGQGKLMKPFNLNQGTEYAFFNLLERYTNVPVALNEFDENSIDENRFRAIKGIFDGEGRQKGSGIKNKSKTQKIHCTVILMGQFLSTKDDNSVLSRCIPCSFKQRQYTVEQTKAHKELKTYEEKGLSGILPELLKYRSEVAEFYSKEYDRCLMEIKAHFTSINKKVSNRMTANCTALYTMLCLADKYWKLPFTMADAKALFINLIDSLNDVMQTSDSLAEFWSFTEYMLEQTGDVVYNRDLKVEAHTSVVLTGKDGDIEKEFPVKRLLFIRAGIVHKGYERLYRVNRGKAGLNYQTVSKYLQESEAYIGVCPRTDFYDEKNNRKRTSCMVFDYDKLKINLETNMPEPVSQVTLTGKWIDNKTIENKLGDDMAINRLIVREEGKEDVIYKCFTLNTEFPMIRGEEATVTGDLKVKSFKKDGELITYRHVMNVVGEGVPF